MSDIFLSPDRPLYQGAQVVAIKKLDKECYYHFADSLFKKCSLLLPKDLVRLGVYVRND